MKTISVFAILFSFSAFAQLEVYPTSPTYMVNGDLFGPDYSIIDADFVGSGYSYAQFNGVNSNLDLTRGFVITTGRLADPVNGILGPNELEDAGYDLPTGGHPLLSNLAGGAPTFDAAVLTLKFVPYADTLVFNYSFGSEEYDEYVGSTFNDPAAVFLIGPGIPAPTNILTIGGANVGVNTVHGSVSNQFGNLPAMNQPFYFSNPISSDPTTIEYDGFTINTQARFEGLQIGEEYEMIIAIADAGDGIFDSGLFIEACETCVPFLGSKSLEDVEAFDLFPNPTQNTLQITVDGTHEYTIMSSLGQLMQSGALDATTTIEVSSLAPGTYFVQLDNGQVARFIKQ